MSTIERYSRDDLTRSESVLEHMGWCGIFSYIIGTCLRDTHKCDIDVGLMVLNSTIHDIDETITGDVPRGTKYSTETVRSALETLAEVGVEKFAEDVGLRKAKVVQDWDMSKGTNYLEQYVPKLADLFAVVYKSWYEIIMRGNYTFARLSEELRVRYLPTAMPIPEFSNLTESGREYLSGLITDAEYIVNEACRIGLKHGAIT